MLTEMRLEECELDCALIGKRVRTARKAKKVTQEETVGALRLYSHPHLQSGKRKNRRFFGIAL